MHMMMSSISRKRKPGKSSTISLSFLTFETHSDIVQAKKKQTLWGREDFSDPPRTGQYQQSLVDCIIDHDYLPRMCSALNRDKKASIEQAKKRASEGEVLIFGSSIIAKVDGELRVMGASHNQRIQKHSAILHTGRFKANVSRNSTIHPCLNTARIRFLLMRRKALPAAVRAAESQRTRDEQGSRVTTRMIQGKPAFGNIQPLAFRSPKFAKIKVNTI
ncbi:hypothetical protein DFH11DRAFT_1546573 [Phellopilus nigrolimitatus]|nr:hypothetical protein DFH11DRAFT_1546573 [Phellopilus nigrolimitatus]